MIHPARLPRILIISPVKDEAEYLQRTIDSMTAQTVRPATWIIVDDGSSDATGDIADRAAADHPSWIRVLHRPPGTGRRVGPGVIEAFYAGLGLVDLKDYDYVCKLDGDLEFGPNYFADLLARFDADPRLGTISGKTHIPVEGRFVLERTGDEFSHGVAKLYRRECFEEIGGFVRQVMWDGIDCHRCRMLGWKAMSVDDPALAIKHLRQMGSSHKSVFHGRRRWGMGQYFMGTHPLYLLGITGYRMLERPWVLGGLNILFGYAGAAMRHEPRYEDPRFRRHLHRWQLNKLRLGWMAGKPLPATGGHATDEPSSPGRYVLISGSGRSGTNWLLDTLNWSDRTACRNEPNELKGSSLSRLPRGTVVHDSEPELEAHWDDAVRQSVLAFGVRDRRLPVPKRYMVEWAQRLGWPRVRGGGHRRRKILGPLFPSLRLEEWPIPRRVIQSDQLNTIMPVLKVIISPGWIVWALRQRPEARVLHIVRYPGGFVNSYKNRWLAQQPDAEKVLRDNRDRLAEIAKTDPVWAERFGAIESMSLLESNLWFWRYSNEMVRDAGREAGDRYTLIVYERMVADPMGTARSIYGSLDLEWTPEIEARIAENSRQSDSISKAWRSKLAPEEVELIERILKDSPLRELWDDLGIEEDGAKAEQRVF